MNKKILKILFFNYKKVKCYYPQLDVTIMNYIELDKFKIVA